MIAVVLRTADGHAAVLYGDVEVRFENDLRALPPIAGALDVQVMGVPTVIVTLQSLLDDVPDWIKAKLGRRDEA